MSALPPAAVEVRKVKHLVDGLPYWPDSRRLPPLEPMRPSDVHFSFEGLEQFTKALREGIRRAKGGAR